MADAASTSAESEQSRRTGFFGAVLRFFREVVAELKKVVTPTRRELVNYVIIVLIFVAFMMLLISGLDFLFGQGAFWLFGSSA